MNKRTTALTTEQYKEIILTLKEGACGFRPNERVATALVLEGNLGLKDMQNYYETIKNRGQTSPCPSLLLIG